MAVVKPFKAWRYGSPQSSRLQDFVVPPYDVITAPEREALQNSNKYNYSHIILSQGENKHKRAAEKLRDWKDNHILIQDNAPQFYLYKQEFKLSPTECFGQPQAIKNTETFKRYGFFGLVQVEPYENKIILPHEKTFSKYKQDRYELMHNCQGQVEPVFLGYDSQFLSGNDFENIVKFSPTTYDYKDAHGVHHTLWALQDSSLHENIMGQLQSQKLYILDGHHRYETALKYHQDHPTENNKYVLAQVCAFKQPGMIILPTHRLVSGVKNFDFQFLTRVLMKDFIFEKAADLIALEEKLSNTKEIAFGVAIQKEIYLATLNKQTGASVVKSPQELDLDFLHSKILCAENVGPNSEIHYVRSSGEFFDELKLGRHQFGILVRPNTYADVVFKSNNSEVMPHKSTFFFPKVPSGLVINSFDSNL